MKYCFGVISKNQVDTIIDFSRKPENKNVEIMFIPSRRQIEYNGGYVNNWSTQTFMQYVKQMNPAIKIERDHSGPGQGTIDDDGFASLDEDCKYFDIIHIDPWKKYPDLDEGIQWTIDMINYCYNLNPNIEYEIGTEEAIRLFSVDELETVITTVKTHLHKDVYKQIKYCVVQCGNALLNGKNSDLFDASKLTQMITLVKKYNFISKEHNGDWVNCEIIKTKEEIGLECINIAPQFGEIETTVLINAINEKNNKDDYEKLYNLCVDSGKWKKWVEPDFDFKTHKDTIILISGHYMISHPDFQKIKENYELIDVKIKNAITDFILKLYDYYSIRYKCIFCENTDFETLFENDYYTSLNINMNELPENNIFIPYNVDVCKQCNTAQNKYLGNISNVYKINHVDNYGSTKNKKYYMFKNFIIENKNIDGIVEVGACHHDLSELILEEINTKYNIIEPSFTGDETNLNIIPDYIENVDLQKINANTIIMSDVFEHFYNPKEILEKMQKSDNIEYIYLNHPDFDYWVKNNVLSILNIEHTFLIEHQFLFQLFEKYGFILNRRYDYDNFTIFLEFKRIKAQIPQSSIITFKNTSTHIDVKHFFNKIINNVDFINNLIENNPNKLFYLWPCAWLSVTLFTLGLKYDKLTGILDNSPNKIGKYLSGYKMLCLSFDQTIKSSNKSSQETTIFLSCSNNYINELNINNNEKSNVKYVCLT